MLNRRYIWPMSSIALHIIGLVQSLPPAEQEAVCKALAEWRSTEIYGEPWTEADADELARVSFAALDQEEASAGKR
jgi:hypothetical protein